MAKKKILVVDDEPKLIALLKAILEAENFDVLTAFNGKQGLDRLDKQTVDLVVLDFMMPDMTGSEVCRKIRENKKLRKVKIIFLSVIPRSEMGEEWMIEMNVSDYIQKPFENDKFVARIKEIIGK